MVVRSWRVVHGCLSRGTIQITVFCSLLMQALVWTAAGLGFSATLAGVAKLPANLSSTLAGPLGGWLAGRGGGRFALVAGGLVTTAGWLLWFLVDVTRFLLVVAQIILINFGATMPFSVAPTVISQASPPERHSGITGVLTVIRRLFLGTAGKQVT